jgi:hypothetical protein
MFSDVCCYLQKLLLNSKLSVLALLFSSPDFFSVATAATRPVPVPTTAHSSVPRNDV